MSIDDKHVSQGAQPEVAARTHVGRVRDGNEDAFLVAPHLGLFAVADGIGGHACGEVASSAAISALENAYRMATEWCVLAPLQLLVYAVQRASLDVYDAAQIDRARTGMGTTLVCAQVTGSTVAIAHVGDSRLYRLRDGELELLTEDHTYRNECRRLGIVRDALPVEQFGHMLARSIGTSEVVEVDARSEEAQAGDVLLLCSDGLHGMLGPVEISAELGRHGSLDDAADTLVERANEMGGFDNVTCLLLRWPDHGTLSVPGL
jgi:PPM family protein phosphatase